MRRFAILITLICLSLIIPPVAFSQEPKGEYQKQEAFSTGLLFSDQFDHRCSCEDELRR